MGQIYKILNTFLFLLQIWEHFIGFKLLNLISSKYFQSSLNHTNMKKLILSMTMLLLVVLTYAQATEKPVYYLVNYYKADRDKAGEYIDLIQTYASKIWKEKVKSGDIGSYALYRVISTSEDGGYDLISIQTANSINDFSKTSTDEFMKRAFPGMDSATISSIANKYTSLRVPVKSEIYKHISSIHNPDQKYVEVNFMKTLPGKDKEYVRQEKEIYKPIHQEFINSGKRTAWYFSQLIAPVADNSKYNYLTANFFNDWDKSYSITVDEYYKAYNKLFPKSAVLDNPRTMVKTEIWKLEVIAR